MDTNEPARQTAGEVEDKVILEIKPARHPAGGSVEKGLLNNCS